MPLSGEPSEPPPAYSSQPNASNSLRPNASNSLRVPSSRNDIPFDRRRSMEDETRALPQGWVRTFDPESGHQFFVDTTQDPPRSIWTHPYDDEQYLSSLPSAERERIESGSEPTMFHRRATQDDMMAEHTDEDDNTEDLPARPEKLSLGRKLKNKLTGTTHQQREEERKKRGQSERDAYKRHMAFRNAMQKAAQTGEPQYLGKDANGKPVYVQPPSGATDDSSYYASKDSTRTVVNPFGSGMYSAPSSRYARPSGAYYRPRGYGYGGGYGVPLGLGVGGGLLGGLLIEDMMWDGGMGMGMGGMGMGMGGMGMGMGMGGFM